MGVPVILADSIVEPFEQFLDYRKFTVKLDARHLMQNATGGSPELDALHSLAREFRQACRNVSEDNVNSITTCITHHLSVKIASLTVARAWFSFDFRTEINAIKGFILELWTRRY